MRKSDVVRLRHMLDAAREAMRFTRGKQREDLNTDRLLVFGLVKAMEIDLPPLIAALEKALERAVVIAFLAAALMVGVM